MRLQVSKRDMSQKIRKLGSGSSQNLADGGREKCLFSPCFHQHFIQAFLAKRLHLGPRNLAIRTCYYYHLTVLEGTRWRKVEVLRFAPALRWTHMHTHTRWSGESMLTHHQTLLVRGFLGVLCLVVPLCNGQAATALSCHVGSWCPVPSV